MECCYVYKKYIYTKLENPNELTRDIISNTAFYLNLFKRHLIIKNLKIIK